MKSFFIISWMTSFIALIMVEVHQFSSLYYFEYAAYSWKTHKCGVNLSLLKSMKLPNLNSIWASDSDNTNVFFFILKYLCWKQVKLITRPILKVFFLKDMGFEFSCLFETNLRFVSGFFFLSFLSLNPLIENKIQWSFSAFSRVLVSLGHYVYYVYEYFTYVSIQSIRFPQSK